MPRTMSTALQNILAQVNSDSYSWAFCYLVERTDGVRLGFTSYDKPITYTDITGINGKFIAGGATVTYSPTASLSAATFKQSADLSVDNLEVDGILDTLAIDENDVANRVYDWAIVTIFGLCPTTLSAGHVIYVQGTNGQFTTNDGITYHGEVRALSQWLSQEIGDITSMTCRVAQLGDAQCKVSIASFQFSRLLAGSGITVAASTASPVYQINAGGGSASPFVTDTFSSGGSTASTSHAVTPPLVNAAPNAVYQSARTGNFSYIVTGLVAGKEYAVRLHFCEDWLFSLTDPNANFAGQRQFDVIINSTTALSRYDVWVAAGGSFNGIAVDTYGVADNSGNLTIQIVSNSQSSNLGILNGFEIIDPAKPAIRRGLQFNGDTQLDGYYTQGRVIFGPSSSNPNWVGDIRNHRNVSGSAVVDLWTQPPNPLVNGDQVTLEAGCDRRGLTCKYKFSNLQNIHAELYIPGNDRLAQTGRPPN